MLVKVFLSSTGRDLREYREAVYQAVHRMEGFHYDRMENFVASPIAPLDYCCELVRACDVLVGIIGLYYGSCPPGNATSFTEHEYNMAAEHGKPRLMFVAPDDFPVPGNLIESTTLRRKQDQFRKRINTELLTVNFTSPAVLAGEVVAALANWLQRQRKRVTEIPPPWWLVRDSFCPERPPDQLFGRAALLAHARRRVLTNGLPLSICGLPGIGKTAFIAALVNTPDVQDAYDNRILWINLRDRLSTASDIADVIAEGLQFTAIQNERNPGLKLKKLKAAISSTLPTHLIVCDNADFAKTEEELQRFYQEVTPNIIAGMRTAFRILDKTPLLLPELDLAPAIKLFRLHAALDTACARLAIGDERIAPICGLIGNHPLAITLVAPAISQHKLTLEELGENLQRTKLDTATTGIKDSDRDIRAAFALSYNDLASPAEQRLFDAMGAFPLSGAPLVAIATVTGLPRAQCKDILARLRASRLLIQENEQDPEQYRLHPLLHEFARETLQRRERVTTERGAFADTPTGRMIAYYVEYTEAHQMDFPSLEAVREHVIHAAECAWDNKAWEAVYRLSAALHEWTDVSGDWNKWLDILLGRAVLACRTLTGRKKELADALRAQSSYLETIGMIDAAMGTAKESLALAYETGASHTIAKALVIMSIVCDTDPEQAHAYCDEAWRMCQDDLEWIFTAYIGYRLGLSYWSRGKPEMARSMFEKAIDICRRLPTHVLSRRYEAYCVTCLGDLLSEQGQYEQARRHLLKSLELKANDPFPTAISMTSLARLAQQMGHSEEAIKLLHNALSIYRRVGAVSASIRTLLELADYYFQETRYTEAVSFFEEAKTVGLNTDLSTDLVVVFTALGTTYHALGQYDRALAVYQEGLEMANGMPQQNLQLKGVLLYKMGKAHLALKQPTDALVCFEQAEPLLRGAGRFSDLVAVLEALKAAYGEANQADKAADSDKKIQAIFKELGQSHDSNVLVEVANLYIEQRKLRKAQVMLDRANTVLGQHQAGGPVYADAKNLSRSYHNLGRVYEYEDMHEEALTAYQAAAGLLEPKVDPQFYGVIMHDIADVYRKTGRSDHAIVHYSKALECKTRDRIATVNALADVYKEQNEHDKALSVYKSAVEELDSLSEQTE